MQELSEKIAVITGGGSGIGRALALALAHEGMDIAIADIEIGPAKEVAAEVRSIGRRALANECDVSDLASVRDLADKVFAEFNATHVLCNNAGVVASSPVTEMSDTDWSWVIGVDLIGVTNGLQAFLPRMVAQEAEGHIVNTSSIAGLVPSAAPNIISYTAAKYGVVGITETLAEELKPYRIGTSVLCPGVVRTRIGESGRNRPGTPTSSPPRRKPPPPEQTPRIVGSEVIEPEALAEHVVRAIRENDLYIVTHLDTRVAVEARFTAILAAYDKLKLSTTS